MIWRLLCYNESINNVPIMRNGPTPRTIPRKCDFVRAHILLLLQA